MKPHHSFGHVSSISDCIFQFNSLPSNCKFGIIFLNTIYRIRVSKSVAHLSVTIWRFPAPHTLPKNEQYLDEYSYYFTIKKKSQEQIFLNTLISALNWASSSSVIFWFKGTFTGHQFLCIFLWNVMLMNYYQKLFKSYLWKLNSKFLCSRGPSLYYILFVLPLIQYRIA